MKRRNNSLFTLKTEHGRGRCVMLTSSVLMSINAWLTTDIFYTSFLMIYGIDLVNIGIITFIPYIASFFSLLGPSLLERFPRRRWILALGRLLYHTFNILGITLVPVLVQDPSQRILCFIVVIFLANLVNALFGSGYSVWHLNFIPESVRADYILKQSTISSFIGIGISLISGVVADALSASPYADAIIIAFRYVAYVLALVEVVVLALPKEYPYPRTRSRPRLRDIIIMPFSCKPFMLSLAVIMLHTFFTNIPVSFVNYYLLSDVGVQYTFIYGINMIYPFVLIALQPLARRLISRYGWFKVTAVSMLVHAPSWAAFACVNATNYLWLYTLMRLYQHVVGVALNTAYANVSYVNLPQQDQTNYISFYQLASSLSAFLGLMSGTMLIAWIGDSTLTLFGMRFASVPVLLLIQSLGNVVVPVFIFRKFHILDPQTREALRT